MQNTKLSVRILLVLMTVLLLLPMILTSCQETGGSSEETTGKKRKEETVDKDIYGNDRVSSGHEGFSYPGEKFKVFISGDWTTEDIWVDEENYDKTNDVEAAVVTRNLRLSEQYGLEVGQVETTEASEVAFITNSINAADGAFDAISTSCKFCVQLALDGYLIDLKDISTVTIDAPWWDQEMVKQCTMNDHLFWIIGEYTTTDNQNIHAMAFNKKMFAQNAELLGDKSPYDYVNDGTWTLDVLFKLAGAVGKDNDGNGKWTESDIYGFCYPQTAWTAFLNCCGVKFGSVHDTEPYITCDFWSEKTADIWSKTIEMTQQNWSFNWHSELKGFAEDMFQNDRLLFYANYMKGLTELRAADVDFEFGILPYPKYNEQQENYIAPFSPYGTPFMCIPVSAFNPEAVGAAIDLLSYESMYTVTPAYYTITLEGKMSRDSESLEMLNLIFSTKCYDFGFISCWGGWDSEGPPKQLFTSKSDNISSVWASSQRKITKAIDKQLESYENYESQNS